MKQGGTTMRTLRALRNEEGIALVMALGVMFVLTIAAVSVIQFTSLNSRSASYNRSNQDATALAEAGVNFARSILWQSANPTDASAVPNGSTTVDGETVSWQASYNAPTATWTLTGLATQRNPTHGTDITRRVTSEVLVQTTVTSNTALNEVWRYLYADSTTACTRFADNAVVSASMYIRGNLCLDDNAVITGSRVQVMGSLNMGGNSKIGDPGRPVDEVHVRGGCGGDPCNGGDRVHSRASDVTPAELEKPPAEFDVWYSNAAPGPVRGCTSGSFPGGFDNDTVMNASRATVNLAPSSAYDCQVRDGSGTLIGQLAWNPSTRILTVAGTIFFDGPLSVNSSTTIVYSGRATIYVNGTIVFNDNARVCGVAACDSTWNPTANLITFVAGGWDSSQTSIALRDGARVQAALWAAKNYVGADNTHMYGPIIADRLSIPDNARNYEVDMGPMLPGMPQFTMPVYTLVNVAGSTRMS
jgi:Tfp pilus assembly protein PilX